MGQSTMPRYLSHTVARELADEIECAIARVREEFRRKHDAELRGLEHEISLALARSAVRYGVDLLPASSAAAIDRLEVAVAELEARLESARIASSHVERPRNAIGHAKDLHAREAKASAELAVPLATKADLELVRSRFLGYTPAGEAIAAIEVFGAGTLADLALAEIRLYCDDRTVEEFERAAREHFADVGLEVRSFTIEHKVAIFRVGSGK